MAYEMARLNICHLTEEHYVAERQISIFAVSRRGLSRDPPAGRPYDPNQITANSLSPTPSELKEAELRFVSGHNFPVNENAE